MKISVALFTGNRAEYGLQYPIIKALSVDPRFQYYLLVSGAHLDRNFGFTIEEIKRDGFEIHDLVDITMGHDTLFGTAQAIGSCISSLSKILDRLRPNFLVVYADRFEGFAALITGTQMGIPTVHVEGGDVTEGGALDDSVRHAMSKLSHLHFTTNEDASQRLIKMGEEPWRVHTVGFPAIDLINEGNFASPEEITARYAIDMNRPLVVFTQHSIATEHESAVEQIEPSIEALSRHASAGVQVIATFPNNDAGGKRIKDRLELLSEQHRAHFQVYSSLGRYNYHGILNICGRVGRGVCVGNSSSGIKETPAFGCPTVNIGNRQKGRLRAENVIDVPYDTEAIYDAIVTCLEDYSFRKKCRTCKNPYGSGNVGKKVADILASTPRDLRLLQKRITF